MTGREGRCPSGTGRLASRGGPPGKVKGTETSLQRKLGGAAEEEGQETFQREEGWIRKGAQLETLGHGRRMLRRQSVIPASPEGRKEQLRRITRIMNPKLSIEEDEGAGAAGC